ncbi:MAG: VPLPA-CTERM sorting domain-containing protein [Gammaproteobacteria bacterium]
MNKLGKLIACAVAILAATLSSQAATHRLDFAGQNETASYSGYFEYDFNLAVDENPSPFESLTSDFVTGVYLQVNGIEFVIADDPGDFTIIFNSSLTAGDYFGTLVEVLNTSTGLLEAVAIQFQFLAGTLWDTDELPTAFNLLDFDPFDPSMPSTLETGIILPQSIFDSVIVSPLDSASLYAVPLPAGMILMLSALTALTGISRDRVI